MLGAAVAAAALSAISGVSVIGRAASILAAIVFALGVGIAWMARGAEYDKAWYQARAVAESAKSMAWQYAVGGGPFALSAQVDVDRMLTHRLRGIRERFASSLPLHDGGGQVTDAMREQRAQSLGARKGAYERLRLRDQMAWYTQKAEANSASGRRWMTVAIAAQAAGVAAVILQAADVWDLALAGVMAALASAVIAWVNFRDHATLAAAYSTTAEDLSSVLEEMERLGPGEEEWAAFVDEAEQAISREHTLWLARKGSSAFPRFGPRGIS